MGTAKLLMNGRSQAILVPKTYFSEGKEVCIKRTSQGVLLISKDKTVWGIWEGHLKKNDKPLIAARNQPSSQQERAGLDEFFD